jgi:hypothetical protein
VAFLSFGGEDRARNHRNRATHHGIASESNIKEMAQLYIYFLYFTMIFVTIIIVRFQYSGCAVGATGGSGCNGGRR